MNKRYKNRHVMHNLINKYINSKINDKMNGKIDEKNQHLFISFRKQICTGPLRNMY